MSAYITIRRGHQRVYDPAYHCVLCRNRFGRVVPCWGLRVLGRYDCAGGECPIARRFTRTDAKGRETFKP
jgi:hypothetical protein